MAYRSDTIIQLPQFGLVNAYLVREDDGLTLIDAQMPRATSAILAAAKAEGASIKRIAITHVHPDHIGSVDALTKALPGVEFIVPRRDEELLTGKQTVQPGEPKGKLLPHTVSVKSTPTRLVDDGDHVGSLQVVATPGHSPGHVTYFDPRSRTAFCGDVFSTVGGVATTAGPYLRFPLPGFFTWHRPTELASARRVAELDPAVLGPGHGRVVTDPAAAIAAAIARSS
ncbi:MAG: MBL fold metallo-hydrolase [Solirubrobacteraceae bacterium]|nr:MBL fold metallo-hydrolase [Patulibacter sp.]